MTQAKHTPGPWIIEDITDDGQSVISAASKNWIDFARVWVVTDESTDKEGEANARLIAAAPELLEALKDVMSAVELGWIPDGESMFNARAAIAKATGASND